ncbi:hypothetical protein COOONC_00919 [Cooperia oncophora]
MLFVRVPHDDISSSCEGNESTVYSNAVCTSLNLSNFHSSDLDVSIIEGDGGRLMRRREIFRPRHGEADEEYEHTEDFSVLRGGDADEQYEPAEDLNEPAAWRCR